MGFVMKKLTVILAESFGSIFFNAKKQIKFNHPLHPPVCGYGLSFSLIVSRPPFRSAVGAASL